MFRQSFLSTLHRSDHDSLDEMFLHQRIQAQDRNRGDDDGTVFQRLSQLGLAHDFLRAHGARDLQGHLRREEEFPEDRLQGQKLLGIDVYERGIFIKI